MKLGKTLPSLVLVAALMTEAAFAGGGFLQKLPKDGTWVEYNVEMKAEGPAKQETTGTMRLKSVGTVTENGETYRWLEIEFNGEQNGMKSRAVMKALIREKELKAGAKGALKILRGWQQNETGDTKIGPKELSEEELSPKGPMNFFFKTALKNAKTVKQAKTIDYQKGQLKIAAAQTGDVEAGFGPTPMGIKQKARQTVWAHKSIPTGVAAMEWNVEMHRDDKLLMKMKMMFNVQNFGKDAKSALPEKK